MRAFLRQLRESVPPPSDARWRQLAFHGTFVTYALTSPAFNRRLSEFLAGFAACVLTEWAGMYARERRVYFPISAAITSFGLLLLCDSAYAWVYAFLGFASVASKHLIRCGRRHVFNPSNFGLCLALVLIPESMTVASGRWGGNPWGMLGVAALGCVVCARARRLNVAAAYAAAYALGAVVLHSAAGLPLAMTLAPMTGATFAVFTFFMITDPQTSPPGTLPGALFGAAIGLLETVLRWREVMFSHFFTLFALTLVLALARRCWRRPAPESAASVA